MRRHIRRMHPHSNCLAETYVQPPDAQHNVGTKPRTKSHQASESSTHRLGAVTQNSQSGIEQHSFSPSGRFLPFVDSSAIQISRSENRPQVFIPQSALNSRLQHSQAEEACEIQTEICVDNPEYIKTESFHAASIIAKQLTG